MDAMALAQLKRQAEWYAEQVRHSERDLQSAELALEGEKKKVELFRKKLWDEKVTFCFNQWLTQVGQALKVKPHLDVLEGIQN